MKTHLLYIAFRDIAWDRYILRAIGEKGFNVTELRLNIDDIQEDRFELPEEVDIVLIDMKYPLDLFLSEQLVSGKHPMVVMWEKVKTRMKNANLPTIFGIISPDHNLAQFGLIESSTTLGLSLEGDIFKTADIVWAFFQTHRPK